MKLRCVLAATLLLALTSTNSTWGQSVDLFGEAGNETSSTSQLVIVMQQPETLTLNQHFIGDVLNGLPLPELAKQSLPENTQVAGFSVHFSSLPPTQKLADLGTVGYLSLHHDGTLSQEQQRQLLRAVVESFSERLSEAVARIDSYRLEARKARVDQVSTQVQRAKVELDKYSRLVSELERDQSPLTPDELRERISELREQIRELETKRVLWEARRVATQQQIEQMQAEAEAKAKQDPVFDALRQLVKLKERQVATIRDAYTQGAAEASAVAQAETELAEAKIKLLEQQQKQVDPRLASQISTLNARLAQGMVEMIEDRQLLGELEKQLALVEEQLNDKLNVSTEKEVAEIRKLLAKRRLTDVIGQLDQLQNQSLEPATVKVIPWVE